MLLDPVMSADYFLAFWLFNFQTPINLLCMLRLCVDGYDTVYGRLLQ